MKVTHNLIQGSAPWHQFRLDHDGASEAAAMLGLSSKVKRSELLRAKHTGLAREFSDWLQRNVLDKGHEVEQMARPHVEAIVGEELFPITMSEGRLSASCDGVSLGGEIAHEHKQWNDAYGAMVAAGEVPPEHMPQCQQVLMVTGAERLIFVISDGTPDRMAHVWVDPDPAWFKRLRDGWEQFHRDLATYVLPESAEPAPVGKSPDSLPALRIEVTGQVTASNLAEFKATALDAIRSVNRNLTTDQDFADAEKSVKWCADVESRLAAAKEHALSQTASIDALFRTIDDIAAEARRVRLDLDKLVTRRKGEVRDHAAMAARAALDAHIATLNAELAPFAIRPPLADFAGAIKGRRTMASMQDALDGVLAVAKIASDEEARALRANLATFKAKAEGFEFLFADLGQFLHKAADDFGALLVARIETHKAAELVRENQRREAERLRAEEAARQAEAAVTQAAAKQITQNAQEWSSAGTPATYASKAAELARPAPSGAEGTAAHANSSAAEPATLTLGMICERLQFTVRADFLADVLHVKPAKVEGKRPGTYTESQFATICHQLQSHVSAMAELYCGETA